MSEIDLNKIKKLSILSKKLGIKESQLAILWCLKNENVSTVILGASKLSQLKENLSSLNYSEIVTGEVVKEVNSYFLK